jgi:dTMP kinase
MSGTFFCFEGVDKAGKTTAATAITAWLNHTNKAAIFSRAPGQTAMGKILREIALNRQVTGARVVDLEVEYGAVPVGLDRFLGVKTVTPVDHKDPLTRDLIHIADLRETATQVIGPALADNIHVIQDRFEDSTRVYSQAHGPQEAIVNAILQASMPPWVDAAVHIYFRAPAEVTLARLQKDGAQDGGDTLGDAFYIKVADLYEQVYQKRRAMGETWFVVDATKPATEVIDNVKKIVASAISFHNQAIDNMRFLP